tara:strand:- start:1600 stop:1797 length:198 start_codon:yes stop_codon:yes gene_type:complete
MGLINAAFTFVLGYFIIEFIKKNKDMLTKVPIISNLIGKPSEGDDKVSNDAWFLLAGFVLKDLLI